MADSDSVYLFSDKLKLDSTKELTLEDLALHRFTSVEGCYLVSRDPLLDPRADSIRDPDGDGAFALEMKYGTHVTMRKCKSPHHRGRRAIPATEFDGDEDTCRRCARLEHWLETHQERADERDAKGVLKRARGSQNQRGWKRLMHRDGRADNLKNFHKGDKTN